MCYSSRVVLPVDKARVSFREDWERLSPVKSGRRTEGTRCVKTGCLTRHTKQTDTPRGARPARGTRATVERVEHNHLQGCTYIACCVQQLVHAVRTDLRHNAFHSSTPTFHLLSLPSEFLPSLFVSFAHAKVLCRFPIEFIPREHWPLGRAMTANWTADGACPLIEKIITFRLDSAPSSRPKISGIRAGTKHTRSLISNARLSVLGREKARHACAKAFQSRSRGCKHLFL